MPMDSRTLAGCFLMSKPLTVAVPAVGSSSVASIFMIVVFPAPLGPKRPKISPFSMLMLRSSTAVIFPYFFVRP